MQAEGCDDAACFRNSITIYIFIDFIPPLAVLPEFAVCHDASEHNHDQAPPQELWQLF